MIGAQALAGAGSYQFAEIAAIDVVLAGDNAVVIGALAAGIHPRVRRKVMALGIVGAIAARIILSIGVVWLLLIPGIRIIGGVMLLWVAWKMYRDIRTKAGPNAPPRKNLLGIWTAIGAIVSADLSMSLDNVLGVAGAADGHIGALALGLLFSMVLMGTAAAAIAAVIERQPWIAYIGLALILFVAVRMIIAGLPFVPAVL